MFNYEEQNIPTKSIEVPKLSAEVRSFNKEFAFNLADTIKVAGLLVPISVRPDPDNPGRYLLINGKHKLYAVKNVLKQDLIKARVFTDMDAAEAELVRDVEQLWHNPLKRAQHTAALKRWHAHWLASLPPIPEKGELVGETGQPDGPAGATDGQSCEQRKTRGARPKPESHREAAFDQRVADATGQSVRSVQAAKRRAKSFTEEQLEVFAQCDVSDVDMTWIAKIKDEAKRNHVVNLVASGKSVEESMKCTMGDDAPKRLNEIDEAKGSRDTEPQGKAQAKETAEPELSDDEWFDRYCGEKAAMLRDKHKYKAAALLYRAIAEERHVHRCKIKGKLKEAKKNGPNPMLNLANRYVSLSHPKDWLICPDCKGTGDNPATPADAAVKPTCKGCFGGGYRLKTEEYL
jgi:hypothetical protein